MTEIKPPYDELDTIINEYVDSYELTGDEGSYTPTETEKLLIKDAIHGLLADTDWDNAWGRHIAALAKSQPVEQGNPVAKVVSSGPADFPILQWISAELSLSTKTGDLLYTHPVRPMSDEPVLGTKTWMEGGVVMTQNLTASDIYKPVPMTEDEFITAVEASGIEVDNVEAAFAIKRIVELFHGIKGATE